MDVNLTQRTNDSLWKSFVSMWSFNNALVFVCLTFFLFSVIRANFIRIQQKRTEKKTMITFILYQLASIYCIRSTINGLSGCFTDIHHICCSNAVNSVKWKIRYWLKRNCFSHSICVLRFQLHLQFHSQLQSLRKCHYT